MKLGYLILMILFCICKDSFAEEGGYLIKSTPSDVKIYIDDKLYAEQTPYTVKLPEGKHSLKIEKEGKQTFTKEILISAKGTIKDEVELVDIPPPCAQQANFEEFLYPKKDSFEKPEEFLERVKQRIQYHNECVKLNDSRYSVGVGELHEDQYDIETGKFPITVHWSNNTIKEKFTFCSRGLFKIERDRAKALRVKNKEHPIFLSFEFDEENKKAILGRVLIKGENKFHEVAIIQKWHNLRCNGKNFSQQ